ncbi:MAG TPA: PIN domain-containing protein [Thermoanaerobaculia bacterium]|nr:PIN domain-containing protein [Thermoanaerobaculia bacterium]
MTRQFFVDTWYFVAFIDRRDSHHATARSLRSHIDEAKLVTHEAALTEVLAFFSDEDSRLRLEAARIVRRSLLEMTVLPVDRQLFLRALDLYEQHSDKEYSLVDCMSMIVMRDNGITHVLTNDHHFTQAGFVVVNR